jgi:hypothetical protein
MGTDVADDVRVAGDAEVKAPLAIYPGLPNVSGFVELLGLQRRMLEVLHEQSCLFFEGFAYRGRRRLVAPKRRCGASSSSGLGAHFPSGLLGLLVEKLHHLFMGLKGTVEATRSYILRGFGQTGVDDAALLG